MDSFRDIIALWPTISEFAADVGVPYITAASWKQRNSIPSEYWRRVVDAAAKRKFAGVTEVVLTNIADNGMKAAS